MAIRIARNDGQVRVINDLLPVGWKMIEGRGATQTCCRLEKKEVRIPETLRVTGSSTVHHRRNNIEGLSPVDVVEITGWPKETYYSYLEAGGSFLDILHEMGHATNNNGDELAAWYYALQKMHEFEADGFNLEPGMNKEEREEYINHQLETYHLKLPSNN